MSVIGFFKGITSITELLNRILDLVAGIKNKIKRKKRKKEFEETEENPTDSFIDEFGKENDDDSKDKNS